MLKVEVGAGANPHEGYVQCEIRPLPHVQYVCNAWELPFKDGEVDELLSSHMLEHVTEREGRMCLREWARVLKSGGKLDLHVPDLEGHIAQYFMHGVSPIHRNLTNREHAMLGFYGWQQFPEDVHKWGYTWESLSERLAEAGFERITRLQIPDPLREGRPNPLLLDIEAFKK